MTWKQFKEKVEKECDRLGIAADELNVRIDILEGDDDLSLSIMVNGREEVFVWIL